MTKLMHFFVLLILSTFSLSSHADSVLIISSVTVNGTSSTSVSAGASITARITLSKKREWKSTLWIIKDPSGSTVSNSCHINSTEKSSVNSFNITAPSTDGTYDVSFTAYKNEKCSEVKSSAFVLTDGIIVGTTLVASYSFDDYWSSSQNLNDHIGTADGIISGSVSRVLSPTNRLKPETCASALFSGGAIDIFNLPLSTTTSDKTSVSFWMNWNGTNSIMPIGWHTYDLWLTSGNFGFNTGGSDVYGVSSSGLANGWHHIVAVFTNNNVLNNKLYIDGVQQSLSLLQGTIIDSRAVVAPHLRLGGWWRDNGYRFQGQLDELKIYNGETSSATIASDMAATSECPIPLLTLHMDEDNWTGAANEVIDSLTNAYHGTAFNGAITEGTNPAIDSNPGTCRYGKFDGVNDYVSLPNLTNLTGSFTITAWVKSTKGTRGRLFADDDRNKGGFALSLNEPTSGKLRFYSRSVSPISLDTSSVVLPADNNWYFVTAVHDVSSKQRCIYINGILKASGTYTGTWGTDSGTASIGSETNSSGEGVGFAPFGGNIDEFQIYESVLDQSQIQNAMAETHRCVSTEPATLIASYDFDDDWKSTGSLTDRTGTFNGLLSGDVSPVGAAASLPKPDTCRAAEFNGGVFDINSLPVSTISGDQTSVSFWMYWNGTDSVMPIGWQTHDLWLVSGSFGFNTGNSEVFGISSAGLANNWHHVVAVFTNNNVSNNRLYIDGVDQTLSIRVGSSSNNSRAVVDPHLRLGSWWRDTAYRFRGKLDNVKVYNGEIIQAQVTSDRDEVTSCSTATAFSCVATGHDPITGKLLTKLTNQAFTVDAVALLDANTVDSSFSGTVSLELVDASSGSCATHPVLNPAISQSLTFTSSSGIKTSAELLSSKAYRHIKCRITDNTTSPAIVGCSSDGFTIRPENFTVTSSLNNSASSGSPTKKSGTIFDISAETNTLNYDGTPVIDQAQLAAHAGAVQTGDLTGSFPVADPITGNSAGINFTYSEVGNITLNTGAITDSSFAAIDKASGDCTNDASNTADVNGKLGCNIANDNVIDIGRFIPDHFEMSIVNQGSFGGNAYACTNFNYIGQIFSYDAYPEIKITAYNGLTPKAITQNYSDNYVKLTISDFDFTPPTNDANKLGADGLSLVNLNWSPIAPDLTDNHDGSLTLTFGDDNFKYLQQANSLVAPFTNTVEFEFIDITDSDSVSTTNLPLSITPSGALMQFGRLNINNAHGAETAALSVAVITEYFNGTNWTLNSMDSCTSLDLTSNVLLSNPASGNNRPGDTAMVIESATSTASLLNSPFASGQGNLSFSAPGEDNQGYIDIKGSLTGFEWLQFDWDSDGSFNENPAGRASFGLFSGNEKLIFRREVY